MRITLLLAYVAVIAALLFFIKAPWNYAAAGLVLFKGLVFMGIMSQAGMIGKGRRGTIGRAGQGVDGPPAE